MTRRVVVVLVVLGLLAAAVAHLRSDQRRIRRQLAALVETVEKPGPESQLAAAAAARRATTFFAPGFLVRAEPWDGAVTDPGTLGRLVLRLRTAAEEVEIDTSELDVQVRRASRTASASFVAAVRLELGERTGGETWRVASEWVEIDGEWRVREMSLVEPVEGGGRLGLP